MNVVRGGVTCQSNFIRSCRDTVGAYFFVAVPQYSPESRPLPKRLAYEENDDLLKIYLKC